MKNPGLPKPLWSQLDGRLWHATSLEGLKGIVLSKEIRLGTRYKGSYALHMGGVSLFDFGPSAKNRPRQLENWRGWFGFQQKQRYGIWLEIDRNALTGNLVAAGKAREEWDQPGNRRHTFIPGVEAYCRGTVPVSSIRSVLLIASDESEQTNIGCFCENCISKAEAFEASLPPPKQYILDDMVMAALETARKRPPT